MTCKYGNQFSGKLCISLCIRQNLSRQHATSIGFYDAKYIRPTDSGQLGKSIVYQQLHLTMVTINVTATVLTLRLERKTPFSISCKE